MNYFDKETKYSENLAIKILQDYIGVKAVKNNEKNKTAIDVIVENQVKLDIQYSQNFKKYGDLRIDLISAYFKGFKAKNSKSPKYPKFFREIEKKYDITIKKVGKYFIPNYLDAIMVLFYQYKQKATPPDYIFIGSGQEIRNFLENNLKDLENLKKVKNFIELHFNQKEKYNLQDAHGSAFITVKIDYLLEHCSCHFGSLEYLKKNRNSVKNYLLSLARK